MVADAERLVKNVTWMGDALWINASNHGNRASLIQDWLPTLNFAGKQTTMSKMYITIDGQTQAVTLVDVNPDCVGILGVCGWGGIALNAAALDPRIKATVATTMYDMSRVSQNGYNDEGDSKEARDEMRKALAEQRLKDYRGGSYERAGGVVEDTTNMPWFVQQYHAYYKTPRGYHERSLNSNEGWNKTSILPWLNAGFLKFTNEIDNAVMILHGEKAHSRYFGITAYENMTGAKVDLQGQDANLQPLNKPLAEPFVVTRGNKQLYIVPGATHCDLYDGGEKSYIPFDKLEEFYKANLK